MLRANGVAIPAGSVTEDGVNLTVQIGDRVATVEDLKDLYLAPAGRRGCSRRRSSRRSRAVRSRW